MKRLAFTIALCSAFAASAQDVKCPDVPRAACRQLEMAENRDTKSSRTISLLTVVVPAREPRGLDPLFILAGGPGQATHTLTDFVAETFAAVNATRDLVLLDARGTSERNFLQCPTKGSKTDVAGYFSDLLSGDVIQQCRETLSQNFDLTQYTTANIVEDLEEARKRLGYQKINLYGTSYGTRVAQEMMRRHPGSVRSVILDGVVPPSFVAPAPYAQDAEVALGKVFALCTKDEACRTAYPDLPGDYQAMLRNAANGVEIVVDDTRVKVSRGYFGEILRNGLYSPSAYAQVPKIVHAGARGDFAPFANLARRVGPGSRRIIAGMFLSVTCAQDLVQLDEAAARRDAEGTLLGSYRVDQQHLACLLWPRGQFDPAATKPVTSSIPTLIISGEFDPVTSPKYGDLVVKTLSRGRHIVVPYASHSGATDCVDRLLNEFVIEGAAESLEEGCLANEKPPEFVR